MDKEIWKDIEGYEGLYQVSNIGRVRSLKLRLLSKDKNGYIKVNLSKENQQKTWTVHRLVAMAFLEKVDGKNIINHIDGDKTNNKLSNLEWVTPSENIKHAFATNLAHPYRSETNSNAKFTIKEVEMIRQSYIPKHNIYGQSALARKYGVAQSTIGKIIRKERYK